MTTFHPLFLSLVRSLLLPGAMFLVSCSSGPSLNPPTGNVAGMAATKSKLVVSHEQTFRYGNMVYAFPAGDYRPVYQDASGVYYEAPSSVIRRENVFVVNLSKEMVSGGILLDRANPQVARIYEIPP